MKKVVKRSWKNMMFLVAAFIILFITATSMVWTPQTLVKTDKNNIVCSHVLTNEDVSTCNDSTLNGADIWEIQGADSYIVFSQFQDPGQLLKITFNKPLEQSMTLQIFLDDGWGFNKGQSYSIKCTKGDINAEVDLENAEYKSLRIDFDKSLGLESIEMTQYKFSEESAATNEMWFLWAILVAVVGTALIYFIDRKCDIFAILFSKMKALGHLIWKYIKQIAIMLVISAVGSLVWTGNPLINYYQIYEFVISFLFIFIISCVVFSVWICRYNIERHIEKLFLLILLSAGVLMIVTIPHGYTSWDTDVHFRIVTETSYLGKAKLTTTDTMIRDVEELAMISSNPMVNFYNMQGMAANYDEIVESYETSISIAHLPAAIFVALGRLCKLPFPIIFMLGKLANLLLYATLCYEGIKRLKTGKLLFAVIALFPTNVYVAANYSYDYWVTGFAMLGMAYFVAALQEHEEIISTKDIIVMSGSFVMACLPKEIYFPLLLLPFIMPKRKMSNQKKYYRICFLALALLVLLFAMAALGETTSLGDSRGGEGISPMGQVMFILGNIFQYAKILLNFLLRDYLTVANTENYISNFSLMGIASGTFVFLGLMILTFLYDKNKAYSREEGTGWRTRSYVLLMYFGGSALIATALYVAFTPVGHYTINGCQARYIIPWLYPLLSVWSMNKIKPDFPREVLHWLVVVGCGATLFYDIYSMLLTKVIFV